MPHTSDPAAPSGGTDLLERVEERTAADLPWQVLLWNDPVNTTQYVTLTLMRVLEIGQDAAERLMLLAHTEGKASVKSGTRAECEKVAGALQSASLWATMEKVSS